MKTFHVILGRRFNVPEERPMPDTKCPRRHRTSISNSASSFSIFNFQLSTFSSLALLLLALATLPSFAAESASGITEPFLDVTLGASVPGIVTTRKFKEGDIIKEGEILLELDKRLEELETDRRRLVRDQKKTDYDSTAKLFKSTGGVSKEELEKKEVEYRVAAVEHDMAAEGLRRRQLISPLTGTIAEIKVAAGQAVASGDVVVVIESPPIDRCASDPPVGGRGAHRPSARRRGRRPRRIRCARRFRGRCA